MQHVQPAERRAPAATLLPPADPLDGTPTCTPAQVDAAITQLEGAGLTVLSDAAKATVTATAHTASRTAHTSSH